MDRQDIYSKTSKGLEEVKNRKNNLPQALRSLLIMVDGTKPIGAFLDQATALGDVNAMLVGLEQQGFIAKTAVVTKATASTPKFADATQASGGKAQPAGSGGLVDLAGFFTTGTADDDKDKK
jgi:hypothetical protein